jgi:tetratricopeptide (TPR) repeat protein
MVRILAALFVVFFIGTAAPRAQAQAPAELGAWMRAESANFIVYSRGRERTLREAVQTLEGFDALARRVTRAQEQSSSSKLTIYLLNDHDALTEVWPGVNQSTWGFYTAQPDFVAAFAIRGDSGWEGGAQHVLFHEYTHHFMLHYFPQAYPTWYIEGFAEYLSTVEFERGRVLVGQPSVMRGTTLLNARFLPMRTLLAPPAQMTGEERGMFYAQSWLMTHYIFSNQERTQQARRYFESIAAGEDPVEAFEPAFGQTPEAFQTTLREYMRGRIPYMSYPDTQVEDAQVTITRLPRSADRLLLPYARLQLARGASEEAATHALAEAARYPGDAFAARVSAYAHIVAGRPAEARPLLAGALAANPADAEAQFITGLSYLNEATMEGVDTAASISAARRHLSRAFRAQSNHAPTLYYYVQTFIGEPLTPQTLDVLVQAHLLAPQVYEVRFYTAIALMNARRFDEAAAVLRPLIFNPHSPESEQQARRLLEAAERGEMPSFDDAEDESAGEGEGN